ncbi:adenylate/guanylate cyclase domain-containing protein [Flexivirga oryzae]|uniref:Class 3 adenylate cyclase/tetratricopeptide (TPR) repeat protein n=1 Tax=Flexivirga oryzae TaxID=1794944 RepID=A0A839N5K6_9MICO|nr:class 3 adenylate cyclase/tetratricopeptide (TPR) repeat protein [Flexivirga oryzae]
MITCWRCGFESPAGTKFCPNCGAALAQGGLQAPVRKHVVILFVDIVGSTSLGESLDPEALRAGLARYFDAVSRIVWKYGGTVEKFIGDAVMAVFGVPATREDDALRAVRAATDIHAAMHELSGRMRAQLGQRLRVRVGVNSGEVFVTHQPDGQFSVTGDAVNVAARLEAAAGPEETYVGDTVADLVGTKVSLDFVGPITHRGKTEPQDVYKVADHERRPGEIRRSPFVGREAELRDLTAIADRSHRLGQGWFVTYVGEPGIGKNRLVGHFVDDRDGLRVLRGTAQPLGTDGNYGPLAKLLSAVGEDWTETVKGMFPERTATAIIRRLESATARSEETTSTEDIVWAARKVLSRLALNGPIAVWWKDIHWASDPMLDLIEQLIEPLLTYPVLTICTTRPELFERRPMWGGGQQSRVEPVDPLSADELREIAADRVTEIESAAAESGRSADTALDALIRRSDGNPQVFEVLLDSMCDGEELPVSVHTLFEATLDRLTPMERAFCEVGSVLGREFYAEAVGPVRTANPDPKDTGNDVASRLRQLNILEIGDQDNSGFTRYQFAQSMLMETAYRTQARQVRSERHLRAADWLAENADKLAGSQRLAIAEHVRKAYAEIAAVSSDTALVASVRDRAAVASFDAAEELDLRGEPDTRAAYLDLIPLYADGDPRLHDVAHRAFMRSDHMNLAEVEEVVQRCDRKLDESPAWLVHREGILLAGRLQTAATTPLEGIAVSTELVGDTAGFEDLPSVSLDVGWARVIAYGLAGRMTEGLGEVSRLTELAAQVEDRPVRRKLTFARVEYAMWSDEPVGQVLQDVDNAIASGGAQRERVLQLLPLRVWLRAMQGDRSGATADWDQVKELSSGADYLARETDRWAMALYSFGDARPAAEALQEALPRLAPIVQLDNTLWIVRLLLRIGDLDAALEVFDGDLEAPTLEDDGYSPGLRDSVVAQLLAATGNPRLALQRVEQARAAIAGMSMPIMVAEQAVDQAVTHLILDDQAASTAAADRARHAYRRKGADIMADHVDDWLAAAAGLRGR